MGVRPTLVGVQQSGGEQQQPSSSTSSSSRRIVVRRMESKVGVPCQAQQQHNDSQSGQSAGAPQAEGGSTKFSVLFIIFVKKKAETFQLNLETKMSQSLLQRRLLQPCRCHTSTIDHLVEISILGFQQGLELKQIYLQIERKKYCQRGCTWLLFDETMSLSEHV